MSFQLQLETISLKIELCASLTLQFEIGKTTGKGGLCFLGSRQVLWLPCSLAFGSCSWLSYLIFVIFFTQAKFLQNKICTEKRQFFTINL